MEKGRAAPGRRGLPPDDLSLDLPRRLFLAQNSLVSPGFMT